MIPLVGVVLYVLFAIGLVLWISKRNGEEQDKE